MCNELTQKQISAREYYQRNKAKICEQKRSQYKSKSKSSAAAKQVFNTSISKKKSFKSDGFVEQSKDANPEKVRVRRSIEDVKIARELGLSLNDLG